MTFEHPPAWKVERVGEILALLIDPPGAGPFRRNVNILLQRPDHPVTLEEFTELSVREIRSNKMATGGQAWATTLSGAPARRMTHSTTENGGLQYLSVWTVRSGGVWLVTYTSDAGPGRFGGGLPEVERVLASIKLPA